MGKHGGVSPALAEALVGTGSCMCSVGLAGPNSFTDPGEGNLAIQRLTEQSHNKDATQSC